MDLFFYLSTVEHFHPPSWFSAQSFCGKTSVLMLW
jgi:hypothetical protein